MFWLYWPQYAMLALFAVALLYTAHKHGTPARPVNFWIGVLVVTIYMFLLCKGHFFDGAF